MPGLSQMQSTFIVLSGRTGSFKSAVLEYLASLQYPVIDLERIARHKGSVFGSIGIEEPQPSQQFFEIQLTQICEAYYSKPFIFTEQKPSSIGKRKIPGWFYTKMQEGLMVELDVPKNLRVQNILKGYFDTEKKQQNILSPVSKLSGRLSKEKIAMLQELILQNNYVAFVNEILDYYDRASKYQPGSEEPFIEIFIEGEYNAAQLTKQILQSLEQKGITLF